MVSDLETGKKKENEMKNLERSLLIILTILFIGHVVYDKKRINTLRAEIVAGMKENIEKLYSYAPPIPKSIELDFSNKTGFARIQSSFTDLLISSEGSEKKGEGYVVYLKTVNPSSIYLSSSDIVYSWEHNGQSQAATVTNPNENLLTGASVKDHAFLSPVEGDDLKKINVKVFYELMRSK